MKLYYASRETGLLEEESALLPALWLAPEPGWALPAEDILRLSQIFPGYTCFVWMASPGVEGSTRFRERVRVFGKFPALRRGLAHQMDIDIAGERQFCDIARVDTDEAAGELSELTNSNRFGSGCGLVMSRATTPKLPAPLLRLLDLEARTGIADDDSAKRRWEFLRRYIEAARSDGDIPILVATDCSLRQLYVATVASEQIALSEGDLVSEDEFHSWLRIGVSVRL
jgi:hypothetical protein